MTPPLPSTKPGPAATKPESTAGEPTRAELPGPRPDRQARLEDLLRGRQLWTLETWDAYLKANPLPDDEPGGDLWEAIAAARRADAKEPG